MGGEKSENGWFYSRTEQVRSHGSETKGAVVHRREDRMLEVRNDT